MLVELTVMRIAQMRNNETSYKLAKERYDDIRDALEVIIDDRVVSKHATIVGRNPGLSSTQRGRRAWTI